MTQSNEPKTSKFKLTRNQTIAAVVGGVAIIGSAVAIPAVAENRMFQHAQLAMSGDGAKVYQAGWRDHRGSDDHRDSNFADMSDEEITKHVSRMVAHLAIEIDANDDQEKMIADVAIATIMDLKPMHAEYREAGVKLAKLLTSANVDRIAIEALRAERMAATDEVSKKVIDAVAQVSEVLTPQQREGLANRIDHFKSMRGRD